MTETANIFTLVLWYLAILKSNRNSTKRVLEKCTFPKENLEEAYRRPKMGFSPLESADLFPFRGLPPQSRLGWIPEQIGAFYQRTFNILYITEFLFHFLNKII
jgi:hypothetical protein